MRTQIALDDEQHRRAKQKAADLGISLAEYVRRLVDRDLDRTEPEADPSRIFGIGASGGSDIAAGDDEAISAAIDDLHQ